VQVVINSLRIFEEIAALQPIGISDLSRRVGLPKSNVYRALKSLEAGGWALMTEESGGRWVLGPRAFALSWTIAGRYDVRTMLLPAMETLRRSSGETVHLAVLSGHDMVIVDRLDSPHLVRSSYPLGFRIPVYAASTGKAMMSRLPEDEVRKILDESEIRAMTPSTVHEVETLLVELAHIRTTGFAESRGEFRIDIGSVAAPVIDLGGRPVAAVSISAPIQRMDAQRRQELGRLVAETIGRVSVS
jgi:IclR family transcriptional regulator, acetate operon repressor